MVRFNVSVLGLDDLFTALDGVASQVSTQLDEFTRKIAERCGEHARVHWAQAWLKDVNGVPLDIRFNGVTVEKCEDGYAVTANGEDVCFIEFGAGVHYNGAEPYPGIRPDGIVGIGQYGYGQGKKDSWSFPGGVTNGNPAFYPMQMATEEVDFEIEEIAKEVFCGG